MAKYRYISGRRHAPRIEKQEELAKELGIKKACRIGKEQALYPSCPSLLAVLDNKDFLEAGDHMYVADLMCISTKHESILNTLTAYHNRGIILHIFDISYVDDAQLPKDKQSPKSSQYDLLRKYLESFRRMRRSQSKTAPSHNALRGRKAEHLDDLPLDLRKIIDKYCKDASYSKKQMLYDIRKLGYRMGTGKIYRLIGENRDLKGLSPRK